MVGVLMQLKALRYFLMVANTGSFLATARHFRVPASSVSRFVAALEAELGQQLLYRSTRAVRLTEEGERFHQQLGEALELLDQAAEQVGRRDAGLRGLLRVNAPQSLGRMHIARILNDLQDEHPDLTVELTLTDLYIDPIQEGADITVRVGRLVDSGLVGTVVAPNRQVVAASPAYLEKHGMPQVPLDLLEHRCLLYKGQLGAQKWHFRRSDDAAFESIGVDGPFQSNSADALLAAALAGRGIVVFPTWFFHTETFRQGELVALLSDWQASVSAEQTYIQLLSPQSKLRSRKVREVTNYLMQRIGSPPYWSRDWESVLAKPE